jgi:pilus assembly protein CpaB
MTPARIAIVAVALVASIVLALFVHGLFSRSKPAPAPVAAAAPAPPMARVLVAKTDLGVGDRLTVDNITWQPWPVATLNAAYITDGQPVAAPQGLAETTFSKARTTVSDIASGGGQKMQAMIGDIVREPIYTGQPITAKMIIHSGDSSYMAVRLPSGMRAISLPINVESGAGGFIQPGDRIDVLSTHADNNKNGSGGMITETVLTNALVLAIDQHTDSPKTGATVVGATVTLEVPEDSATSVARARSQGGITLALRSYADMSGRTAGRSDDSHSIRIFKGGSPAETVSAP